MIHLTPEQAKFIKGQSLIKVDTLWRNRRDRGFRAEQSNRAEPVAVNRGYAIYLANS